MKPPLIGLPSRAHKAQREVLIETFEAYKAARAEAQKAYHKKIEAAQRMFDKVVAEAEQEFEDTVAQADRTWKDAVDPVRKIFEYTVRVSGMSFLIKPPIELERELEVEIPRPLKQEKI